MKNWSNHILFSMVAGLSALAVVACGYVKVFNGNSHENFTWTANSGYRAAQAPASIVEECKAALSNASIVFAAGEQASAVKSEFTLPATVGNCTVEWSSDNASVVNISGLTGQVVRPYQATDAVVVLTAVLSYAESSGSKTVEVIVSRQVPDSEAVAACKANLESSSFVFGASDTASSVTQNFTLPTTQNGCSISWAASNSTWITAIGASTGVATVARQSAASNETMQLTATVSRNVNGGASDTKTFDVTIARVLTNAEVDACAAALTTGVISFSIGDTANAITSNFSLPSQKITSSLVCTLAWAEQSDAKNAVAISGLVATVSRPTYAQGDGSVTLRATASGGLSYTKTQDLNVTVLKQVMTTQDAVDIDAAALAVSYGVGDGICATQSSTCVTQNLTLPTSGSNGTTISWVSSDSTHLSVSGMVGTVARAHNPSTSPTTSVTLTATISKIGATSATQTYNLVIKPLGTISTTSTNLTIAVASPNVLSLFGTNRTLSDNGNNGNIRYVACVAHDGNATLNSIGNMNLVTPIGPCQDSGTPLDIGSSSAACCTATSIATPVAFTVPSDANQLWRGRVFAYVNGDSPDADAHKVLYALSGTGNPPD